MHARPACTQHQQPAARPDEDTNVRRASEEASRASFASHSNRPHEEAKPPALVSSAQRPSFSPACIRLMYGLNGRPPGARAQAASRQLNGRSAVAAAPGRVRLY